MKKQIAINSFYLSCEHGPNLVRVELGLDYKINGILGTFSRFKQKNACSLFSNVNKTETTPSGKGGFFKLQQSINLQIPIAIEIHIIYHTTPRFRPSTII